MLYKELNDQQKAISNRIEHIYLNNSVATKDFVVSLYFVLNKYKKVSVTHYNKLSEVLN